MDTGTITAILSEGGPAGIMAIALVAFLQGWIVSAKVLRDTVALKNEVIATKDETIIELAKQAELAREMARSFHRVMGSIPVPPEGDQTP